MRLGAVLPGSVLVGLGMLVLVSGCARKIPPVPAETSGTETMGRAASQESEAELAARRERELREAIAERERAVVEESMRRRMAEDAQASSMGTMSSEEFMQQDVHFAYDSFTLSEEAKSILNQKATWLTENADVSTQIEGHCDERGTTAYNLALGERRANTVKEYLVALGVNATRLSTISYGEESPIDPGHTEAAWARNRRAHFVITNPAMRGTN